CRGVTLNDDCIRIHLTYHFVEPNKGPRNQVIETLFRSHNPKVKCWFKPTHLMDLIENLPMLAARYSVRIKPPIIFQCFTRRRQFNNFRTDAIYGHHLWLAHYVSLSPFTGKLLN